jgi:hypothetical protein
MTITCPTCRGKGKTKLSPKLQDVLDVLKTGPASVSAIFTVLRLVERNPSLTAYHRRVERLLKLKLIKKVGSDFPQKYGLVK